MVSHKIRDWAKDLLRLGESHPWEHPAFERRWESERVTFEGRLNVLLEAVAKDLPKSQKRPLDALVQPMLRYVYPELDLLRPACPGIEEIRGWGRVSFPRSFLPPLLVAHIGGGWRLEVTGDEMEGRAGQASRPVISKVIWAVRERVLRVTVAPGGGTGWKEQLATSLEKEAPQEFPSVAFAECLDRLCALRDVMWRRQAVLENPVGALVSSLGKLMEGQIPSILPCALQLAEGLGSLLLERQKWVQDCLGALPTIKRQRVLRVAEGKRNWTELDPARIETFEHLETPHDNPCSLVLLRGDNVEALRWLSAVGAVFDGVLTDPPYNTGNKGVYRYADREQVELWQWELEVRLNALKAVSAPDGVVGVHIDEHSTHRCRSAMDAVFGPDKSLGTLVWRKKVVRGRGARYLLPHTEYVHFAGSGSEEPPEFGEPVTDEMREDYKFSDEEGVYKRIPLAKTGTSQSPRPNLVYDIKAPDGTMIPCPTAQWRWSKETLRKRWEEIEFIKGRDGRWRVYTKQRLIVDGKERLRTPSSYYDRVTTSHGTREIKDLFGSVAADFPKPTTLLMDIFSWMASGRKADRLRYLDIYAGSGSSLDALLRTYREDGKSATMVGVERSGYFDELTVERVARAIESDTWRKGNPIGGPTPEAKLVVLELEPADERLVRYASGNE